MSPPDARRGATVVSPDAAHAKGGGAMTERAEFRSYYGRPIIKEPVWTWEIPLYLLTGGLTGASSTLGAVAQVAGNEALARRATLTALAMIPVNPALLVSDLGRPERFLNMLRLFKVTSPMSVGSWLLTAHGAAATTAGASELTGRAPSLGRAAGAVAGALGAGLATYTALLLADTAVPAWHEARHELPFVFAGGAMASAGACAAMVTPVTEAAPARRLVVAGAALELGAAQLMERRLGMLGEPYRTGTAGRLKKGALGLSAGGALALATLGRRSRVAALAAGAATLAGAVLERWGVFRAGVESARDPRYTVVPQRQRVEQRRRDMVDGRRGRDDG
jgi:Polysulphide reductase, NrfD